ncbi:MAG TPA: Bax inhibitor-1/YccA family protein [Dongiaceae bacterium]|nr:Bax inhibitor-1/YccA family protein [Dongiaceae bacterium]
MATGPQRDYLGRSQMPAGARAAELDVGLRAYMQKVFGLMGLGTAITGLVAFFTANSPAMLQVLYGTPLRYVIFLAPLAFVLVLSFGIQRMRASTAQLVFWLFAGVMGLSLASIFLVYTGQSIVTTFFVSSATFFGMALYGYTTKRDLTAWGSFLFMGLIGLLIASLVGLFVQSSALQFAISVIGVLIFTGLTAYDTQKIKEMYYAGDDAETGGKKAVMGALRLYLDFINLFLYLLRFLGDRR